MEMHQIRYFLAVAEDLNFTRAAAHCNVAQPSLTRAVKLLEDELGGPLFHRERANTHLTELGRMVRPHLEEVYARAQQAKDEALDFTKRAQRTHLKIGLMCTIAPRRFVDLLGTIDRRHPGVELDIVDASAAQLEEMLEKGDLEIAIYARPFQKERDRLHYMQLFREQMMIAVSPEHKFAGQNAVRSSDLDGERYINRVNCEFTGLAGPIWRDHGARTQVVYRSERDDWVLAMVAAGLGFGFMPEHCISHPGVVARPLIDPELWRDVSLVTVRGRPYSPAVGAFVREAVGASQLKAPASAVV